MFSYRTASDWHLTGNQDFPENPENSLSMFQSKDKATPDYCMLLNLNTAAGSM